MLVTEVGHSLRLENPTHAVVELVIGVIYINDMPSTISHSQINMYADDTALYASENSAVLQQLGE